MSYERSLVYKQIKYRLAKYIHSHESISYDSQKIKYISKCMLLIQFNMYLIGIEFRIVKLNFIKILI